MSKDKVKTRLMVYVGVAEGKGNKLYHSYVIIQALESAPDLTYDWLIDLANSESSAWFKSRMGHARPGKIIEVEIDPSAPGRVYVNTAKVVGSCMPEICLKLQASSQAIETASKARKEAEKDGRRDLVKENLEPLREVFRNLRNKKQRSAFLARVVDYITS